jgi:hypothetical protein
VLALPAAAPPGFAPGADVYVGMVVDHAAHDRVLESNETNNANRGVGLDSDSVALSQTGPPGPSLKAARADPLHVDAAQTNADVPFALPDRLAHDLVDALALEFGPSVEFGHGPAVSDPTVQEAVAALLSEALFDTDVLDSLLGELDLDDLLT